MLPYDELVLIFLKTMYFVVLTYSLRNFCRFTFSMYDIDTELNVRKTFSFFITLLFL